MTVIESSQDLGLRGFSGASRAAQFVQLQRRRNVSGETAGGQIAIFPKRREGKSRSSCAGSFASQKTREHAMRIILAATPATGHLDPVLGIAHLLRRHGHETLVLTGSAFRERVQATGAGFAALPPDGDCLCDIGTGLADHTRLGRGAALAAELDRAFVKPMVGQFRALASLIDSYRPDGVIADHLFLGAVPLMLSPPATRPFVASCGVTFLGLPREDGLPHGFGLSSAQDPAARAAEQALVTPQTEAAFGSVQARFVSTLQAIGVKPRGSFLDVAAQHADIFWQGGLPELDYPRANLPTHIRHIGLWPAVPQRVELPDWAERLADGRRLILVTQGTVANGDLEQLLLPTLRALAHRNDLIVIGATGGRDPTGIIVPDNARLAANLPLDWVLPHVHALVSNGGFGTVLLALACGVPMVIAGESEDKREIAARIASSGAGLDLRTARPNQADISAGVEALLEANSPHRRAAHAIANGFARCHGDAIILESLEEHRLGMSRAA
ncbi:glycosyltransferase [Sphingomonas sp. PAMC 26605]|uniref:glycosyltransferase n=1 Tax=Sphingomonas sp. PAMC 26605 TaxID=1112214 RepID=UPI0012F48FDD|nr:glycosyltransferase [Sphingomonas sp. PAMC 26605]